MIDITRHRPQKWYANEQEECALVAHCIATNVKKSEFVRAVVMSALQPRTHRIRAKRRREGPKLGLSFDLMLPGRRGGAPTPLRL